MTHKLNGVHPELAEKIMRVLAAMEVLGFPMMVTDGLRTTKRQQELYAQGRTKPGKIVTNADGVRKKSNHQAKADGFGHAVDSCFVVDGKPSWGDDLPWTAYGECAKALGLKWGIKVGKWIDRPHVELVI